MLPGKMLLWHFKVKSFVKIGTIPAEKLFGRTNVTDTWNPLKIIPEAQVFKLDQNCDRNRSDIADIEFAVGGIIIFFTLWHSNILNKKQEQLC